MHSGGSTNKKSTCCWFFWVGGHLLKHNKGLWLVVFWVMVPARQGWDIQKMHCNVILYPRCSMYVTYIYHRLKPRHMQGSIFQSHGAFGFLCVPYLVQFFLGSQWCTVAFGIYDVISEVWPVWPLFIERCEQIHWIGSTSKTPFTIYTATKIWPKIHLTGINLLHSWNLTWSLKRSPWKRRFLLETIIFSFHVKIWGCNM